MSFGVGITDIVSALQFAKSTYEAWRDAPENYHLVKRRLLSLRGPLQELATHFSRSQRNISHATTSSPQTDQSLEPLLSSLQTTLSHLNRIISKRRDLNFWDRLRLTSHEISDLGAALDRHVQDLTFLCGSLGLANGRDLYTSQQNLQRGQQDLRRGQDELIRLVAQLMPSKGLAATSGVVAGSIDSDASFLTKYGDGDVHRAVLRDNRRGRQQQRSHSRSRSRAPVVRERDFSPPKMSLTRRDGSRSRADYPLNLDTPPPSYSYRSASPLSRGQSSSRGGFEVAEFWSVESTRERSRFRRRGRRGEVEVERERERRSVSVEMRY